jgi:hypothetical protein
LPLLSNSILEVLTTATMQEKENNIKQIGKKEMKMSLFAGDMSTYRRIYLNKYETNIYIIYIIYK